MNHLIKKTIFIFLICTLNLNSHAQENKNIITSKFKVDGVCKMCKERIENAALIKGVKLAEWNVETDTIKVIYKSNKVNIDEIHKSIANIGHSTDKIVANKEAYDKLPSCCAYMDGVEKH
jgi:hypothetical protein